MLSESVGNTLSMGPDKDEVSETARFVKMFDKYVIHVCTYCHIESCMCFEGFLTA